MRLADGIHVEWVEAEAVVLDPETKELHYLNPQAALVLALIGEVGWAEAREQLRSRFGDEPGFEEDLERLMEEMRAKKLVVDE